MSRFSILPDSANRISCRNNNQIILWIDAEQCARGGSMPERDAAQPGSSIGDVPMPNDD